MNIKSILESLLFVNERPIEVKEFTEVLGMEKKVIVQKLDELVADYAERDTGVCIVKVAGGYQMCSLPANEEWVRKMFQQKNKQRFSTAALETVAIIAYKQPVTRAEIALIRGVNVDGVMRNLLELGLIKEAGRKEVPGRPFLYITTRKFLEYFGLNSLNDLPKLEEFSGFEKQLEESALAERSDSEEDQQSPDRDCADSDTAESPRKEESSEDQGREQVDDVALRTGNQHHLKTEG